jgi:hypothetical protein
MTQHDEEIKDKAEGAALIVRGTVSNDKTAS